MRHYAGLDVSLEETAVCVVDEAGRIVKEARVPSEPAALVGFFQALGLEVERVGLEACSLAAWLHEGLIAADLPAVCIETRHAKAAMSAMPNKTDRNDPGPPSGLPLGVGRARHRADHPHRLVPSRPCQEPGEPGLARLADRTAHGAEQAA